MLEKIIGVVAMATFIAFAAYIAGKIGEIDLWIVVIIVAVMAAYDFYLDIFKASNGNENGSSG